MISTARIDFGPLTPSSLWGWRRNNTKVTVVTGYASAKTRSQPGQGKPITLFMSAAERVSAAVARRRMILTRAHPASHPVYCALTLLTLVARRESGAHPLLTRAAPTRLLTAHKPHAGQLVVWWVTTCESWLLYVFAHPFFGLFGCACRLPSMFNPIFPFWWFKLILIRPDHKCLIQASGLVLAISSLRTQ